MKQDSNGSDNSRCKKKKNFTRINTRAALKVMPPNL